MNNRKREQLLADEVLVQRANCVLGILNSVPGENIDRDDLKDTPLRVAKVYSELLWGYQEDAEEALRDAIFSDITADDLVIVKDIEFCSLCAHHMLPFFGKVSIAYIPKEGKVVGISKLARVAEIFSKRLQSQEDLGKQIAGAIKNVLDPLAIGVVIEAEHTCMTIRGIRKPGAKTVTSHMEGLFKYDGKARAELIQLLK